MNQDLASFYFNTWPSSFLSDLRKGTATYAGGLLAVRSQFSGEWVRKQKHAEENLLFDKEQL